MKGHTSSKRTKKANVFSDTTLAGRQHNQAIAMSRQLTSKKKTDMDIDRMTHYKRKVINIYPRGYLKHKHHFSECVPNND